VVFIPTYEEQTMTADFEALHAQLADLAQFGIRARNEESVTGLRQAIERDERQLAKSHLPQRQRIESPHGGAQFAAREVGRTILALAGWPALCRAHDRIEAEVGAKEASWLSRQWLGLTGSAGEVWTD
jgi:hypothetical protein